MIGAIRRLLPILVLSFCGFCQAAPAKPPVEFVGLWQYPERGVWVRVDADGTAFQCRIPASGTPFKSAGRFVPPHAIEWTDIWGIDQLALADGKLRLSGKYGVFAYGKPADPMDDRCLSDEAQH